MLKKREQQQGFPGGVHPTNGLDKALTMDKPSISWLEEPMTGAYLEKIVPIPDFSREEILEKIEEAGIVGMGGAGFPTHIKYSTSREITHLLINGAECEPYLTCDYRLMLEQPYGILNGCRILKAACGAHKACLCIEDNKQEAISRFQKILESHPCHIELVVLKTRYPQGGERQLIQTVMGAEVPLGAIPAQVGAMVSNIATAKAVADAVLGDRPLDSRMVTVTGRVKNPGNYLVPVGTNVKKLLLACGGVTEKENLVILGGPMTGKCIDTDWDGWRDLGQVGKTTSGILVLRRKDFQETPCIRCNACAQVCPAGLIPYQIEMAYLDKDQEGCASLYAQACIACGCCSYICPARRQLAHRVVQARNELNQRRKAAKNS